MKSKRAISAGFLVTCGVLAFFTISFVGNAISVEQPNNELEADETVEKGYLGIVLNDAWDFFQEVESWLHMYGDSYGYYKAGELMPGKGMRATNLIETYWQHRQNGGTWQPGEDRNDQESTILIISSHGCIHETPYNNQRFYLWHYRTDEVEREIQKYDRTCGFHTSRQYFMNRDYPCETLVKMGAKCVLIPSWPDGYIPYCAVGAGTTRWVILHSCFGLNLDSPHWNKSFPHMITRLWSRNGLNAGFRLIAGASGSLYIDRYR